MIKVTHFYREQRPTGWSIEGIFQSVKQELVGKVDITDFYCQKGLSRIQNVILAAKSVNDINHITGDVNFLAFGLRKSGKTILTIHDLGHYDTLKKRSKLQFIIYKWFWLKLPLKIVDCVTVISEFTKQALINSFDYPEEKIRVIPDPVKRVFIRNPKPAITGKVNVLHIGTSKHKNLLGLVEAVKNMQNIHLDIVATLDDEYKTILEKYKIDYTEHGRVTDEQLNELYSKCDILYFASFYEGFGMPIIEAQHVGRPVITSNIGAMKEVANESAYLVDPHDVNEINKAINDIITDKELRQSLVLKGFCNVEAYTASNVAYQYYLLYQDLANNSI